MSFWGAVFGMGNTNGAGCGPMSGVRAGQPQVSAEETTERLEGQKEKLEKNIEIINKRIEVQEALMRKYHTDPSKKQLAMQAFRQKTILETDLKVQIGSLEKITHASATLQRKQNQVDTVDVLDEANQAMRAIDEDPRLKQADKVIIQLERNAERGEDLNQTLSDPLKGSISVTEDDFEREMARLNGTAPQVAAPSPVLNTGPIPQPSMRLPTAPAAQPSAPPPVAASLYSNAKPAAAAPTPAVAKGASDADIQARLKRLTESVSV